MVALRAPTDASSTNFMTEIVDKSYFIELTAANQETICRNGRCQYSAEKHQYSVAVWDDHYLIDPAGSCMDRIAGNGPPAHEYFDLFVIYYLLRAGDTAPTGEWVSEKDLPGGATFFRGPHQVPTDSICKRFDNDLQGFKACCANLGGTPLAMADAAFRFTITPDIPIAVLYWLGDEDFPAEAKILYDKSIIKLLSLDIIFALAVGVCTKISAMTEKGNQKEL